MSRRAVLWWVVLVGAGVALLLVLRSVPQRVSPSRSPSSPAQGGETALSPAAIDRPPALPPSKPPHQAPLAPPYDPADFPIAARLNDPAFPLTHDLEILQQLFDAWRTNFPREGNPVGENADITAALTGDNRLGLRLVPQGHPAINSRGELCDRWGTPFRFHQLSGEHMEIRSAGPDRQFATADDAIWTPQ